MSTITMANQVVKYSLLSFPIASCGLGYWQIKRLGWKKGLIADLEQQMRSEPLDLLAIDTSKNMDHLEYRRVKASGRFDTNPDHQLYLKPRALVVNEEALMRGRSAFSSNIGVNVITPFQVDGTHLRILVNRGWLPSKCADNVGENAQKGLHGELQELTGVLRKSDKRATYGLNNDETQQEWHVRDVQAMSRRLNTAPILVDVDQDVKRSEGPYGGQTQLNIRNEHLNYAITWFSLAVLSWIMWYMKFGKRSLRHGKRKSLFRWW